MGSELPERQLSSLRRARKAQGLRQADVAERAGIGTSYVSMIEHGLVPPAPVREKIARALSTPAGELWGSAP